MLVTFGVKTLFTQGQVFGGKQRVELLLINPLFSKTARRRWFALCISQPLTGQPLTHWGGTDNGLMTHIINNERHNYSLTNH